MRFADRGHQCRVGKSGEAIELVEDDRTAEAPLYYTKVSAGEHRPEAPKVNASAARRRFWVRHVVCIVGCGTGGANARAVCVRFCWCVRALWCRMCVGAGVVEEHGTVEGRAGSTNVMEDTLMARGHTFKHRESVGGLGRGWFG